MALNERQLKLYNYLLNKSAKDEWTTRLQVLRDLKDEYGFEEKNLYFNSSAHALTKDIQILNYCLDINKIIIYSTSKGIKIANEREAKIFLERNFKSVLCKLDRHNIMQRKVNKDGQLSFSKGKIKETKAFTR